jgi:tRNA pseudouridine38-40 synthase
MMRAGQALVGTHDFTSFAASDGSHNSAVRSLYTIELHADGPRLDVTFVGSAFLKQMVRNLVGTLVEVGQGKRAPDSMAAILAARDRRTAGATAPALGLTLERVWLKTDPDAPKASPQNAS